MTRFGLVTSGPRHCTLYSLDWSTITYWSDRSTTVPSRSVCRTDHTWSVMDTVVDTTGLLPDAPISTMARPQVISAYAGAIIAAPNMRVIKSLRITFQIGRA